MAEKILIVDDDPDVILFLSTVLQDNGYETVDAADGRAGLEKARTEQPALILLDLMMPHKSGIAFLQDLQGDGTLNRIPVVMVTGVSAETGINLQAFFRGENAESPNPVGFVEKPIDPEKLLVLIADILKGKG